MAATLAWGGTCTVRVRFTARGPSAGGGGLIATWPAEVVVKPTRDGDPASSVRIPVRAALSASTCLGNGPVVPILPD